MRGHVPSQERCGDVLTHTHTHPLSLSLSHHPFLRLGLHHKGGPRVQCGKQAERVGGQGPHPGSQRYRRGCTLQPFHARVVVWPQQRLDRQACTQPFRALEHKEQQPRLSSGRPRVRPQPVAVLTHGRAHSIVHVPRLRLIIYHGPLFVCLRSFLLPFGSTAGPAACCAGHTPKAYRAVPGSATLFVSCTLGRPSLCIHQVLFVAPSHAFDERAWCGAARRGAARRFEGGSSPWCQLRCAAALLLRPCFCGCHSLH